MRAGYAALSSHSEYCVPDTGRSSAVNTQSPQIELSFAYAVHQFNAGDRDCRVAELLEPEHHRNALLDATMVLFNQVIEVFRGSQLGCGRQPTSSLQLPHRTVRRSVAIQRDRLWRPLVALHRLAEESLGGCYVTLGAQPKSTVQPPDQRHDTGSTTRL